MCDIFKRVTCVIRILQTTHTCWVWLRDALLPPDWTPPTSFCKHKMFVDSYDIYGKSKHKNAFPFWTLQSNRWHFCCIFGITVLTTVFLIFFIAYKQRPAYWHEIVGAKRKRGGVGNAFLSAILLRTKTYKRCCHLRLFSSGFSTKIVCVCILTFSITPSDPSNRTTIFGDDCKLQNIWVSDVILSIYCPLPITSWKSVIWSKNKN
jgi:hypothetical protein